jgi:phosphate-selective porin OprO and OprP
MRTIWVSISIFLITAAFCRAQQPYVANQSLPSPVVPATAPPPPILGVPSTVPDDAAPIPEVITEPIIQPEKETKPIARIIGRINADTIFVSQSHRNIETFGVVDNAVGFRRAFLGAQGEVGDNVYWSAEFDFAGGSISFKDVYIGLQGVPLFRRIQVGHQIEPFSLEGATSSNDLPFVERSPIYDLDPQWKWGACAHSFLENELATFHLGIFRDGTSNSTGNDISNFNDVSYDGRITYLPWYADEGRYLMHIGAAFSDRAPPNGTLVVGTGPQNSLLQFSDDPATFIKQITIPSNQYQIYNLQWAAVFDALSFQAEWNAMGVQQRGGGPVFLNGCYAFASLFLTGEHRQYDTKDGAFGTTQVLRPFVSFRKGCHMGSGPGAWELTARFAYARFTNKNIPLQDGVQQGDNEAETVFGLNWYLNDNTRIMLDYVHDIPVDPNSGPSFADAFFIRCAIFW